LALFFTTMAIGQFTLGPAVAAGKFNLRQVIRTPVLYSVAAALTVLGTGITMPLWISNTTTLLGNCAVPLMLFAVFNYLWALRYDNSPEEVAAMVLGSTVLTFLALPLLLLNVM
jgi:predicted permease